MKTVATGKKGLALGFQIHHMQILNRKLLIPTDVYSVTRFWGTEAGSPEFQVPAILVSFSAGALAASVQSLFRCISKYLSRNSSREITIEKGDVKLIMKGRSAAEEKEFINFLFPEFAIDKDNSDKSSD